MAGLPMYEPLRLSSCFLRSAPQHLPMSLKKSFLLAAEWPDLVGAIYPPTAQRLADEFVLQQQPAAGLQRAEHTARYAVAVAGLQAAEVGTVVGVALAGIAAEAEGPAGC
jgi:hypothetical protein